MILKIKMLWEQMGTWEAPSSTCCMVLELSGLQEQILSGMPAAQGCSILSFRHTRFWGLQKAHRKLHFQLGFPDSQQVQDISWCLDVPQSAVQRHSLLFGLPLFIFSNTEIWSQFRLHTGDNIFGKADIIYYFEIPHWFNPILYHML